MRRVLRGAREVAVVGMLAFGVLVLGGPVLVGVAAADCYWDPETQSRVCEDSEDPPPEDPGPGVPDNPGPAPRQPYDTYYTPACMTNGPPPNSGDAMCSVAAMACQNQGGGILMRIYYQWEPGGPWELQDTRCVDSDEQEPVDVTPEDVRREMKEELLPVADVAVDPGNGRTLVGFRTNFYTEAQPYAETVQILGQDVQVRARPVSYLWTWGDGSSEPTDTPGGPYPDLSVTHEYDTTGTFDVDVDVVWTGEFNDGGGWEDMGQVTVTRGQTAPVTALSKQDVLSD